MMFEVELVKESKSMSLAWLFSLASQVELKVMDMLNKYEEALGQKLNRSKTSLFFSKSVSEEVKHGIKVTLGVPEIMQYEKYLRLPSLVGKGKKWALVTLRRKYGGNFKGGKQNYSSKRKGSALKSSDSSHPYLHYGMF